jgi:hypothetical protein
MHPGFAGCSIMHSIQPSHTSRSPRGASDGNWLSLYASLTLEMALALLALALCLTKLA